MDKTYHTETLMAKDISSTGMWTLSNGNTVDLRHVNLQLPNGYGDEQVSAIVSGTDGGIEYCPNCERALDGKSLFIIMENHFYLVGKCCNTMMLYDIENKMDVNEWI